VQVVEILKSSSSSELFNPDVERGPDDPMLLLVSF
jgi:hypothetical protein